MNLALKSTKHLSTKISHIFWANTKVKHEQQQTLAKIYKFSCVRMCCMEEPRSWCSRSVRTHPQPHPQPHRNSILRRKFRKPILPDSRLNNFDRHGVACAYLREFVSIQICKLTCTYIYLSLSKRQFLFSPVFRIHQSQTNMR